MRYYFILAAVFILYTALTLFVYRWTTVYSENSNWKQEYGISSTFKGKEREWEHGPVIMPGPMYGPFNQVLSAGTMLCVAIKHSIPFVLPGIFPHFTMKGSSKYVLHPEEWLDEDHFIHPVLNPRQLAPPKKVALVQAPWKKDWHLRLALRYYNRINPGMFDRAVYHNYTCAKWEQVVEKRDYDLALVFCFSFASPTKRCNSGHNYDILQHDFALTQRKYDAEVKFSQPYVAFHVRMPDTNKFKTEDEYFWVTVSTKAEGGKKIPIPAFVGIIEALMRRNNVSSYFIATNQKKLLSVVEPLVNGTLLRKPSVTEDGGIVDVMADVILCSHAEDFIGVYKSTPTIVIQNLGNFRRHLVWRDFDFSLRNVSETLK
eukprot:gb/GECH01002129.1/.p1 GENE.gb/GECH01002129.1/~~gb/GECH01002129.1/.p1  ORF type:complete len:373 (+),score=43.21 gb/GECH01002129.1/:1-1119(+)